MRTRVIQPEGWKSPRGYANGVLVEGGARTLYLAGQIAWDAEQRLTGAGDMAAQFAQALGNVAALVEAAGGRPTDVVRMTVFVVDKRAYLDAAKAIGAAWREIFGRHYPAMSLVQVADLLEEGALVEIEATAVLADAAIR